MKIYPGNHKAYFKPQTSLLDIPLAYVYNEETDRILDIRLREDFGKPSSVTPIVPYQVFPTEDTLFFDKNDKPIWDTTGYIRQSGSSYTVLPEGTVEFYPKTFTFRVILRRNDTYKRSLSYPISFCLGQAIQQNQALVNAMLAVIQNTEDDKQYPSNIVLNGGTVSRQALLSLWDESSCDFLIQKAGSITADKIREKLSAHTNLWLCDDSFDGLVSYSEDIADASFMLEDAQVFSAASGFISANSKGKYYSFDDTANWDKLDEEEIEPVSVFISGSPVRIFHYPGGGYLILSPASFLENLSSNKDQLRLFIELILYVYLHTYFETKARTSWITDESVDRFLDTVRSYAMTHPRINLKRILSADGYNPNIAYVVQNVPASSEAEGVSVSFVGLNRFDDMIFRKESTEVGKDPAKGNKMLVYTTNRSLLLYDPDYTSLKLIESGIQIRQVDIYQLGISATRSSKYRIYTTEEQFVALPSIGTYVIYYAPAEQKFKAALTGSTLSNDAVPVADVTVSINEDITYKDIRKPGGGEASAVPNYEMIDTGNRYGRPYRYGCPMIIQLPSRYKPMRQEILSEVQKHIASGDYPIIIYKD